MYKLFLLAFSFLSINVYAECRYEYSDLSGQILCVCGNQQYKFGSNFSEERIYSNIIGKACIESSGTYNNKEELIKDWANNIYKNAKRIGSNSLTNYERAEYIDMLGRLNVMFLALSDSQKSKEIEKVLDSNDEKDFPCAFRENAESGKAFSCECSIHNKTYGFDTRKLTSRNSLGAVLIHKYCASIHRSNLKASSDNAIVEKIAENIAYAISTEDEKAKDFISHNSNNQNGIEFLAFIDLLIQKFNKKEDLRSALLYIKGAPNQVQEADKQDERQAKTYPGIAK